MNGLNTQNMSGSEHLEQILNSDNLQESFLEAGYEIEIPEYIRGLGEETFSELKSLMVRSIDRVSANEAYFAMKDVKRMFFNLYEDKIKMPDAKKYFNVNKSMAKKINEADLKNAQRAKKVVERNIELLKSFIDSKEKAEIVDYLSNNVKPLVPVGEVDPQKNEQQFYTTEENLEYERIIIEYCHDNRDDYEIKDKNMIKEALAKKIFISEEQTEAVYECVNVNRRISIVEGVAGAGKSFTMEVVKEAFEKSGYAVMGTALSWNAAGVLRGSAKIDVSKAIEGFIADMEKSKQKGEEFFERDTLLIVDEAGLVGIKHMAKLLQLTGESKHKVKVVITGDIDQLDPVTAGAAMSLMKYELDSKVITTIRRQKLTSHKNMVYAFRDLRSGHGLNYLFQQEAIHFCEDDEATLNRMAMDYMNYKYNNPDKVGLLLSLNNKEVIQLNNMIRSMYKKMGWVYGVETPPIYVSDMNRTPWLAQFAVGDEVALRFNDKSIPVYAIPDGDENKPIWEKNLNVSEWTQVSSGVFNKNNGKVISVTKMEDGSHTLIIEMVGDISGRILINTKKYISEVELGKTTKKTAFPVVHNFATTIYSSQGQTVDAVFMKDSNRIDFRLAYVGASRHREEFYVYASIEDLVKRIKMKKKQALPKEVLTENIQQGRYEETPSKMPLEARYGVRDYIAEMSSSWGRYTKKLTVNEYLKTERKKKNGEEVQNTKSLFTVEDDSSPTIKGGLIVDTCVPDFVLKKDMNLLEVAIEKNVITNLDGIQDSNSPDHKKLINWIETVVKLNGLDSTNLDLKEGTELYFDKGFKYKLPKKVDFYKLGEMTDVEIQKSKDVQKIDSFTQEVQAVEDHGNPMKLNYGKIKELEDREKAKTASMFGENTFADMIFGQMFEEDIVENEKRNPNKPMNDKFSFQDYAQTDRYSQKVDLESGGLNRMEIEKFAISNQGKPPTMNIPLLPEVEPDAYVNLLGELRFKSAEKAAQTKDEKDDLNELAKFTKKYLKNYWGLSRYKQPRVFATDLNTIRSRYDLEGNCVSGEGYPPTLFSPLPNHCNKVLIVPDFKSALLTSKFFLVRLYNELDEKNDTKEVKMQKKANVPNVIWGAKDVDWGLILKEHPNYAKKMVIIVGKEPTDKEVNWAKKLQAKIFNQYNIRLNISGKMPDDFKNIFDIQKESEREAFERKKRAPKI